MTHPLPAEVDDFLTLVSRMRVTQRSYFRRRDPATLAESKDLERRVDAALDAICNPPRPDLFTEPKE